MLKNKLFLQREIQSHHDKIRKKVHERLTTLAGLESLDLPQDIPNDGQEFYEGFDPFVNEDTGDIVEKLAQHQIEI